MPQHLFPQVVPQKRRQQPIRRVYRRLLYPVAAVALGLTPFAALEIGLRGLAWTEPDFHSDPFAGFVGPARLFVLDNQRGEYRTSPARFNFFAEDAFPANRGPTDVRIFCLGGSTVQGRPFSIETSFTTWLELGLRAADPEQNWHVVNCGGVSYASYRLIPVLEEVLTYEPDLIVLYTGHNEFLEDRTYDHIPQRHPLILESQAWANNWRTFVMLREGYLRLRGQSSAQLRHSRPLLSSDVQARLDFADGLRAYHRDPAWRHSVVAHFRYNLRRLLHLASAADVPVLLVNPVANLRDNPPFKTELNDQLTPAQRRRFVSLLARAANEKELVDSLSLLHDAAAIDPGHAGVHYSMAKCYDQLGDYSNAYTAYVRAKDQDVCPLRMTEDLHAVLWKVGGEANVDIVDARQHFERVSRDGIPGGYFLVDHVHPSVEGHQHLAALIIDAMVRAGSVSPQPAWERDRALAYERHLASLDDFYFLKGQESLRALQAWTQGQAARHADHAR